MVGVPNPTSEDADNPSQNLQRGMRDIKLLNYAGVVRAEWIVQNWKPELKVEKLSSEHPEYTIPFLNTIVPGEYLSTKSLPNYHKVDTWLLPFDAKMYVNSEVVHAGALPAHAQWQSFFLLKKKRFVGYSSYQERLVHVSSEPKPHTSGYRGTISWSYHWGIGMRGFVDLSAITLEDVTTGKDAGGIKMTDTTSKKHWIIHTYPGWESELKNFKSFVEEQQRIVARTAHVNRHPFSFLQPTAWVEYLSRLHAVSHCGNLEHGDSCRLWAERLLSVMQLRHDLHEAQ
eukprot:4853638-Amphidinium_carterae.1